MLPWRCFILFVLLLHGLVVYVFDYSYSWTLDLVLILFFFCNNLEFAFSALLCFLCSGDVGQLATFMHTGNRWLICFFVAFFHSSTFSCKSHTPKANTNGWFHFVVFKNVTSPKTQIKLWMKLTLQCIISCLLLYRL